MKQTDQQTPIISEEPHSKSSGGRSGPSHSDAFRLGRSNYIEPMEIEHEQPLLTPPPVKIK